MTGMIQQPAQQQIPIQTGMQNVRWMSPSKQPYNEQQTVPQTSLMEPPQYPNPYYGGSQPQKLP